jgi:molybdate transport system substrate-binding protein
LPGKPVAFAVFCLATVGTLQGSAAHTSQRSMRGDLRVAAAASLSGLAPTLAQRLHDATGIGVRFNFAGSNTLARQIVEGARVDVFISADEAQMDVVERAGRVVSGTRADIIGNQLVVIAGSSSKVRLAAPDDLVAPSVRRLAMGDPAAVPAGVYGRQWLEALRLWADVESKVVPLPTSPSVVAAVREGRADAGIVYATDAKAAPGVRVTHLVALDDAPRIVYPAAAITGGRVPLAREFIGWLQGSAARDVFEAAGFLAVPPR